MPTINDKIITMSERGQVTIPNKLRQAMPFVRNFTCQVINGKIVLNPLKTREEFLQELDAAEKEWQNKGGLSLDQIKAKYDL